jgi:hypothetical protein
MVDADLDDCRICRRCGTPEDLVDAEEHKLRVGVQLTCGCWQATPRPGEMVWSMAGGAVEVWEEFDAHQGSGEHAHP